MKDELFKELYNEYIDLCNTVNDCQDKIKWIAGIVEKYGGTLPNVSLTEVKEYPENKVWKEKILFVLDMIKIPASTLEVANMIAKYEKKSSTFLFAMTITQFLVDMSDKGIIKSESYGEEPDGCIRFSLL